MSEFPTFARFHAAVTGLPEPLPWQSALADSVAGTGQWPTGIGVPTGLGKTTCIDIAVWALARDQAVGDGQRRAPTRIWYVVNRRLLVDAATDRAHRLQGLLRTSTDGPLKVVADALAAMSATRWEFGPLHVARLRGGVEQDHRPPDPSCPSIVLSTVPMFGSRLLFRGFGVSPGMRPIDAALAGTDSLVLLDEAHLAMPLQKLLAERSELTPAEVPVLPAGRETSRLVNLTATGDESSFDLTPADETHPLVRRRLDAAKPTRLEESADAKVPDTMADAAVEVGGRLVGQGVIPAVVLFTNTARRAPLVVAALGRRLKRAGLDKAEVVTLTGRLRPHDAETVRSRLLNPDAGVASGRESDPGRPLFVVATQTLEVGADLDFDALVTESAGVRALTQRFGRLNRLGDRPHAEAVIVHANDVKNGVWPVYGEEPAEVWSRLLAAADDALTVALSPGVIAEVLGAPGDQPPPAPELLPNFVREWAKTSPPRRRPDEGELPVEPFIVGEDDGRLTVSVLWRHRLPRTVGGVEADSPLFRLEPAPVPAEVVELPIREVREWLGEEPQVWVYRPDNGRLTQTTADAVRPGDVVAVPTDRGGYDAATGWDPDASAPVDDLSGELTDRAVVSTVSMMNAGLDADAIAELAVSPDAAQSAHTGGVWGCTTPGGSDEDTSERVEDFVASTGELLAREASSWSMARPSPVAPLMLIRPRSTGRRPPPRVEAEEELSIGVDLADDAALLDVHLVNVGARARAAGVAIGLPDPIVEAVALAGRLHDCGKADPRFQLMLGADAGEALAKSRPGQPTTRAIWPSGGRHEAISGRLVEAWMAAARPDPPVDADLVMHLVMSHHGHGRPLVQWVDGSDVVTVSREVEGMTVSTTGDLGAVDWAQPARFARLCDRYGYWGLTLLEAVLRQADHTESSVQNADDSRSPIGVS
ncbi:MAG: type I-U CRISPR-associated helicase/endonuclease Cas3 [Acidimicrobiales bacterium]